MPTDTIISLGDYTITITVSRLSHSFAFSLSGPKFSAYSEGYDTFDRALKRGKRRLVEELERVGKQSLRYAEQLRSEIES